LSFLKAIPLAAIPLAAIPLMVDKKITQLNYNGGVCGVSPLFDHFNKWIK